ncbi:8ea7d1c0-be23-431f-b20b-5e7263b7133e [Thermothielavioides terrestris]|uniref:8ea7d1c0-be23-431f-b20b-5e7263b7133e n=1 Tax=Thermothielavioides terrestris TaxID=2587410 RepID=A0A3S4EYY2_9PEZI|nr:8ea7d1c0-be23-431f-b20b-5e7263b7133e [Thermothielavioides terrestris]
MPRHNGTRAAYELLEQWICCDCKEIYNTATVLRCLNCHHIFDRSHCEVEEHWVRTDPRPPRRARVLSRLRSKDSAACGTRLDSLS